LEENRRCNLVIKIEKRETWRKTELNCKLGIKIEEKSRSAENRREQQIDISREEKSLLLKCSST
jgi:hypothetical protein